VSNEKTKQADEVCTAIEKAVSECGVIAIRELPKFAQAIRMAKGMREMRLALTPDFVKHGLLPLAGSTLGFLTDLDSKPVESRYGIEVVRDCAIEAMIRGFNVVGNEFNIIAGRFYGTKNGYSRLVAEFPGLTDLVLQPGVPELKGDRGALVPFVAKWRLNGRADQIECKAGQDGFDTRIPVKVNSGMGPDAILGKAERKILFRIYQRVNGSSYGATDGEVGEESILAFGEPAPSPVPAGTPEGRRISLKKKQSTDRESVAEGAAATEASGKAPPPAAKASAAPEDLVNPIKLLQMLREACPEWDDPDFDGGSTVAGWAEEQRRSALEWVTCVLSDGPMAKQAARPAHTLITSRQPGDD
jgi:hypothetical protein